MLPSDYNDRKDFPLMTFLTAYFPDGIEALVELSKKGNVQHNVDPNAVNPFKLPGDRIMWDRSKSMEQVETAMRHLWDHARALRGVGSVYDSDGVLHITKAFWRSGAETQLTVERERNIHKSADPRQPGPEPVGMLDVETMRAAVEIMTPEDPLHRDLPLCRHQRTVCAVCNPPALRRKTDALPGERDFDPAD